MTYRFASLKEISIEYLSNEVGRGRQCIGVLEDEERLRASRLVQHLGWFKLISGSEVDVQPILQKLKGAVRPKAVDEQYFIEELQG